MYGAFVNRIWVLADVVVLLPFFITIVLILWSYTENGTINIEGFCNKCCTQCCIKCFHTMCNAIVGCGTKLNFGGWKDRITEGEREKNIYLPSKEIDFHSSSSESDLDEIIEPVNQRRESSAFVLSQRQSMQAVIFCVCFFPVRILEFDLF